MWSLQCRGLEAVWKVSCGFHSILMALHITFGNVLWASGSSEQAWAPATQPPGQHESPATGRGAALLAFSLFAQLWCLPLSLEMRRKTAFTCLAPMVPLAGYCEVFVSYGAGAGSLLFGKNMAVNLPAAAMALRRCLPGHPANAQRWGPAGPLCLDGPWKTRRAEALLLLQSHAALWFQASPTGHFAERHRAPNGTGVEESAEHSPAGGVASVLIPALLCCNYNEQPIFWQTKHRKMSGFLPTLPSFSSFRKWSWAGMRQGQGQSPLLLKQVTKVLHPLLQVWDFPYTSSPESCTLHPCIWLRLGL